MSETAIAIRGLTKAFGRYAVLRGIDLESRAGEVTALRVPNAEGNSTLGKVLCGLHRADAGGVRLAAAPCHPVGPA